MHDTIKQKDIRLLQIADTEIPVEFLLTEAREQERIAVPRAEIMEGKAIRQTEPIEEILLPEEVPDIPNHQRQQEAEALL